MVTLATIALTCWLCTLIALPRKPLPNNEVQELVYTRLLRAAAHPAPARPHCHRSGSIGNDSHVAAAD